jgi:hypothetical protein
METLLPMPPGSEYIRFAGHTFYLRGPHPTFSDRYLVSYAHTLRGKWYHSTVPVCDICAGFVSALRRKHGEQRVPN